MFLKKIIKSENFINLMEDFEILEPGLEYF